MKNLGLFLLTIALSSSVWATENVLLHTNLDQDADIETVTLKKCKTNKDDASLGSICVQVLDRVFGILPRKIMGDHDYGWSDKVVFSQKIDSIKIEEDWSVNAVDEDDKNGKDLMIKWISFDSKQPTKDPIKVTKCLLNNGENKFLPMKTCTKNK